MIIIIIELGDYADFAQTYIILTDRTGSDIE